MFPGNSEKSDQERLKAMKNTATLTGGCVVTPMRILQNGMVVTENGKITYVGAYDKKEVRGETIDACGRFIAPGFIDIHTHGGGGHDFTDGCEDAFFVPAEIHARHGTTTLLPTAATCPDEELLEIIEIFRKVYSKPSPGANMPGLHLEGPFFSEDFKGAQRGDLVGPPIPERYIRIADAGKGLIMRWSAAPELDGGMEFGRFLRSRGIIASIAHSSATDDCVAEAIENGYSLITHLYCAMSGIVRKNAFRYPGVTESPFIFDCISAEIIADGCHVPANLLRLCFRELGPSRLCLVTDSMRGAGEGDGESVIGSRKNGLRCIIEDGVAKLPDRSAFAGSVATADRLVSNMIKLAGAPIEDAVRMMTMTPAKIMALKNKGILCPGADADIIVFDSDINISRTYIGGTCIYSAD